MRTPDPIQARIGIGYDVHRTGEGNGFPLGGVRIPAPFGLVAHSDGDVLIHALIDAMFGALALGDIGSHFPDDDPEYRNVSGAELLGKANEKVRNEGFRIGNLDATIIAEKPKLTPHIPEIREKLASLLSVDPGDLSVKATTHEGLGPMGKGEGIAVHAVLILLPHR